MSVCFVLLRPGSARFYHALPLLYADPAPVAGDALRRMGEILAPVAGSTISRIRSLVATLGDVVELTDAVDAAAATP